MEYYPGSLKGFMEKYYPLCNQNISVSVFMNISDWYDYIDDLIKNGLKMDEDFCRFDTDHLIEPMYRCPDECTWRKNLNLGVGWLKGRYIDGYVYVWLTDENQGEACFGVG